MGVIVCFWLCVMVVFRFIVFVIVSFLFCFNVMLCIMCIEWCFCLCLMFYLFWRFLMVKFVKCVVVIGVVG